MSSRNPRLANVFLTLLAVSSSLVDLGQVGVAAAACNQSTDSNPSYTNVDGLINYWTFCGSYNDSVGTAHGFGGLNANLTSRSGIESSALRLTSGYIQVPADVYFKGDYTVTAWYQIRYGMVSIVYLGLCQKRTILKNKLKTHIETS